ncbi:MAG: hypothetical protein Q8Q02_16265 [Nocardioides sp.]|nr:hypothetical protein [Nocardioides sp.]
MTILPRVESSIASAIRSNGYVAISGSASPSIEERTIFPGLQQVDRLDRMLRRRQAQRD